VPRLRRGMPNVGGVWGGPFYDPPHLSEPGRTTAPI